MPNRTETPAPRRDRDRSSVLSLAAAVVTFALFAWSFILHSYGSDSSAPVRTWLVAISVPAIAMSLLAAVQYRRTPHTGAGAAAVAVYWLLTFLLAVQAGPAYVPGAVLQTVAWFISRPRRARTVS